MRSKSAGGLKVRALAQTARGAGLSPAWHSKLFLLNCSKKIIYFKINIFCFNLGIISTAEHSYTNKVKHNAIVR